MLLSTIISMASFSNVFAKDSGNLAVKIGIVNPVVIYQSVPQGERNIQALHAKLKPQADKLQQQQNDLLKAKQKLQNDTPSMAAENIKKQQTAQVQKESQLQQEFTAFRQSAAQEEQTIAQLFQENFNTAVSEVAKTGDYTLIFSSQAIAYAAPGVEIDITQPVIKKMKGLDETSADADKKLTHLEKHKNTGLKSPATAAFPAA